MKKTMFSIIRDSDKRGFEMSLETAINMGWTICTPLQIIVCRNWFTEPTLIYVQMVTKTQ